MVLAVLVTASIMTGCSEVAGPSESANAMLSGASRSNARVTKLDVPEDLSAVATGSSVLVSWSAVSSAIGYQVIIQCTACSDGASTKVTTTSVTFNNLANGVYSVKIRALAANYLDASADNSSPWSGTIGVTVAPSTPTGDVTAPTIGTPVITGTLGNNGWYTSDVTITWPVSDNESGIASSTGCSVALTSNTAGESFTCSATNGAGLTATSEAVTIKRDATVPAVSGSLSGTMGNNGWFTSSVTLSWAIGAAGPSGTSNSADCSVSSVTVDGTFSYTCTVTSGAGLSGSSNLTGKKDGTIPSIAYSGNAGSYTVDQTVVITCSASDVTSGIATSTCANLSQAAYLLGVGSQTLSATAVDNAGNTGSASTTFSVTATYSSTCTMVKRWVSNAGIANSLCVKLEAAARAEARGSMTAKAGSVDAFIKEVKAQTGKAIAADKAAYLVSFASAL